MSAAGRAAVRSGCPGGQVQDERCVFAGSGQQQVGGCRHIRAGQKRSRPPPRQCEPGRSRDDPAGSLGRVGHQRLAEQVGAAAPELAEPDDIRVARRGRTSEDRVVRDRRLRQGHGRIAVEDRIESLFANVRARRRPERPAVPLDREIAYAVHRLASD
ncbi:MAG: hypothetical protein P8X94_00720 [Woeseiaceae bacterium]